MLDSPWYDQWTYLVHVLVGEVYVHGNDADLLRPLVLVLVSVRHSPGLVAGGMILADSHCLELD